MFSLDRDVPRLGFGAGHIGAPELDEDHVGHLLNAAVDAGVTFIDTARGYGLSEERVGRHLSWRRGDFTLSTKVGYGVDGYQDWTADCVRAGVDAALARLQTDFIDVVHLHSCPRHVLEHHGVVEALCEAVAAGKVGVAAYSGENDALAWALEDGRLGAVQCSINLCDQYATRALLPAHRERVGVIAKRPLANAPWRFDARPEGHYCEVYWERLRAMDLDPTPLGWHELALRFVAHHTHADTCIVGTSNLEHLRQNVELVQRGPLPEELARRVRDAFSRAEDGWRGEI